MGKRKMKERPCLMSAPMVLATLNDTKNHTRRIVSPQPTGAVDTSILTGDWMKKKFDGLILPRIRDLPMHCPYGKVGDQIWVRESLIQRPMENFLTGDPTNAIVAAYAADNEDVLESAGFNVVPWWKSAGGLPSIFMPKWASRIQLEIVSIRVERLQDISEADSKAEGCEPYDLAGFSDQEINLLDAPLKELGRPYRNGYALLWDSINGTGSWALNPWVWVIEYRRLKP